MELVGRADKIHRRVGALTEMFDVGFLAFAPRALLLFTVVDERIAASLDDCGDGLAEHRAHLLKGCDAALVFRCVVQEGGDRSSSDPPFSSTSPLTAIRCEMYGICVPLRSCLACSIDA